VRRVSFSLLLIVSIAAVQLIAESIALSEAAQPGRGVVIRRDTFGIPHIVAPDAEGAGFGLGYAQAEDHAEEIGRRYLAARGEAAVHFGRASLENDLAMRRVDNRRAARAALATLGGDFRRWLRGFVAGVNLFASQHRAALPRWMPVIDEADVLAYGRASSIRSALDPPRALLEKYPGRPAPTSARRRAGPWPDDGARRLQPGDADGSNAFALAGSRTVSGRPILLGNPHLTWASRYWEAHVTIPGRLNFFGSTLVGIPVLRAGFSDRLGYVQTNNYPDLEDIYALPLDPRRPDRYVVDGRSRPLLRVPIAIEVLEDDGSIATVAREFLSSEQGPIVHETADRVFAIRSSALESWRSYEGFFELAFSRSRQDFERRLSHNLHYFSNFTYADTEGNILYQWNARLPRRPDASVDYALDVPGSKRFFWRSLHRVADLPRLANPPGGYVQNANNPPWWTSLRDRLEPARYPSSVEQDPLALRPQVALEALESRQRFGPDDVLALKFSTRMLAAERVLPELLAAVEADAHAAPDVAAAAAVLRRWDRHMAAESRGAVLFQAFWDRYREGRAEPFREPFDPSRPLETPRGLADPAAAVRALAAAAAGVQHAHEALDVAWGDVHRFRFDGVDLPADGAPGTAGAYRVLSFEPAPDGRRIAGRLSAERPLVGSGDAWVLLVHFTRPLQAWSVLAYGQTTRAGSRHASDQIATFAAHRLRPVWFTDADIEANLEREYRPVPE
jgi:acyl-homoserine-lactone acylase